MSSDEYAKARIKYIPGAKWSAEDALAYVLTTYFGGVNPRGGLFPWAVSDGVFDVRVLDGSVRMQAVGGFLVVDGKAVSWWGRGTPESARLAGLAYGQKVQQYWPK